MEQHLLAIKNLNIEFGKDLNRITIIHDLNLYLDKGEILAIAGESGCGKSMTTKAIMGILPENQTVSLRGSIEYKGTDLLALKEKQRSLYRGKDIALIGQDSLSGLNPTMTVGKQICESVMTHKKVSLKEAKELAIKKMSEIGLPDPQDLFYRYPYMLSGGQRQRIMITMAIACEPQIVIADEPTTALDPTVQLIILDVLRKLRDEQHISVMMITHDLRVASAIADRIAVMYAGSIVEMGDSEDLFNQPAHPYTWGLLSSIPTGAVRHKDMMSTINGAPPENAQRLECCSFSYRCPYFMEVCRKATPPVSYLENNHFSSCWLHDRRSPHVCPPRKVWMEESDGIYVT